MRNIKSFIGFLMGMIFGIGLVLSCTDGSPDRADAATCGCPSSEPPIKDRLIVVEGSMRSIPTGEVDVTVAVCPDGTQFLSGTCTNGEPTLLEDITLQQFRFNETSFAWSCVFKNNRPVAVQVKATALCLKPSA